MNKPPAVFVDRDGTLIREVGYLCRIEQIDVLPGVTEGLRLLHRHGLRVAVVTNQSAVARGFITEEGLCKIHQEIERRLANEDAFLDGIYYCPHHPTEGAESYRVVCRCRKPNIGLVEKACTDLGVIAKGSYVIGDQPSDMELADRIGAKGILIERPKSQTGVDRPLSPWIGVPSILSVEMDFRAASRCILRDLCLEDGE